MKHQPNDSTRLVVHTPTTAPLSVSFNGWYVDGASVSTAGKGTLITAKITLTNGSTGQYRLQVRRDISLAADEVVTEISFTHNGVSTAAQLFFRPPYATGEASTHGYYVELIKDSNIVWSLVNTYPPRLTVTKP